MPEALHLLHPAWLALGAGLIAAALALRLAGGRLGDWHRVADRHLLQAMLRRGAVLEGARRASPPLALLAGCLIALALAEPATRADHVPAFRNTRALTLVLDMSPEMIANGRLDDLQATAAFIVQQAAGRPISVILYAGEAYLASEATTDPETPESIIAVLDGATMPETGNRPEEGLELARTMILAAQATAGDVVLIGAGRGIGTQAQIAAERLRAAGATVSTIAVAPRPGTSIDAPALRLLAEHGGGDFAPSSEEQAIAAALAARAARSLEEAGLSGFFEESHGRQVLILALLPAFLLLRRRT